MFSPSSLSKFWDAHFNLLSLGLRGKCLFQVLLTLRVEPFAVWAFYWEEEDNAQAQLDSPHRAGPTVLLLCHVSFETWKPKLKVVALFRKCPSGSVYLCGSHFCWVFGSWTLFPFLLLLFFWQHVVVAVFIFFASILIKLLLLTNILLHNLSERIRFYLLLASTYFII